MHLKEHIKSNFMEILREKPILLFFGLTAWISLIIGVAVDLWDVFHA